MLKKYWKNFVDVVGMIGIGSGLGPSAPYFRPNRHSRHGMSLNGCTLCLDCQSPHITMPKELNWVDLVMRTLYCNISLENLNVTLF
jgi:hypothetical protein